MNELDSKALETLGADVDKKAEKWILSNDKRSKKFGSIEAMHWLDGIKKLFAYK